MPCLLNFSVLHDLTVLAPHPRNCHSIESSFIISPLFKLIRAVRLFIPLFRISNRQKPFSAAMDSSSASSALSFQSSSSSDPEPEHDPIAAYEARAPLWWDARDWDFSVGSEDDESLTDGEDNLQFLVDGELEEESDDDAFSWGADISSDEEEEEVEEDASSDEYPPAKRFRAGSEDDNDDDDDEEDEAPAGGLSSDEDVAGSSADSGEDGDDEGSDGP